jgi:sortase A
MSKRGSTQLLLLFFRSCARHKWGIGAATAFLVLIGAIQTSGEFHLMAKTGLAQLLRQSAWEEALSNQAEPKPWPWEDTTLVPSAKVPRLGLSAAILTGTSSGAVVQPMPRGQRADLKSDKTGAELGDVAIGDSLTVIGADGSSHVYRVTGRRVVDPHLAETEQTPIDGEVALVTCWPLDPCIAGSLRLVIRATEVDPPVAPKPSAEQKL